MTGLAEITTPIKNLRKEDRELLENTYQFSAEVHKDQERFSGEPYVTHAFETAKILAELGMGPITIAAGLLHDTLEDGGVAPKILEQKFGKEILFLVEGVTKLGKLHYHGAERYTESLQKLFVAMAQDLRVLIIKFCDRLHNMRTLQFVTSPEKRLRIAKETLDIYAPLAYRLGIRHLNRELEDRAFPYVYPKEHEKVKTLLKQKHKENLPHLEKFHKSVAKALAKTGIKNFHIAIRLKGVFSLYRKLNRKQWDIEKIYDISALRIIVPTVEDCYRVLGVIHGTWRPLPGRIKDYIAFPKPNGYRAIHTTVFTGDGGILEVQIRTEEMDYEAEFGIAAHFAYKEHLQTKKEDLAMFAWVWRLLPAFVFGGGNGTSSSRKTGLGSSDVPSWVRELGALESTSGSHAELMKHLKTDFFENRVFVFTPKGDVIDLPIDSSPIDFAYAIHSEIGGHIAGAKINGKLVSLDSQLKNGDIVEIVTKDTAHPSPKWLDVVKTALARRHIKTALEKKG